MNMDYPFKHSISLDEITVKSMKHKYFISSCSGCKIVIHQIYWPNCQHEYEPRAIVLHLHLALKKKHKENGKLSFLYPMNFSICVKIMTLSFS